MNCEIYLRNAIVYIPTMGKMGEGFYRGIEPVAVVPVGNSESVQQALQAAIMRGNPSVPMLKRGEWPPPVLLRYAGVKSWSVFERGMQLWDFRERNGTYEIAGNFKGRNGMWIAHPDRTTRFPPGTPVNAVIERMIAILQEATATAGN
jgi:hypothetical protein